MGRAWIFIAATLGHLHGTPGSIQTTHGKENGPSGHMMTATFPSAHRTLAVAGFPSLRTAYMSGFPVEG